jgi:alanine racemase
VAVRALARVNLAAIERNIARLRRALTSGAELCAVVKADGYGHGAAPVARAAFAGGASWLAVATASEAAELRTAGVRGRLLVMGAVTGEELPMALEADADVVAWSADFVDMVIGASRRRGRPVPVHIKLDTGMGRLGTRELNEARALAERVIGARQGPELVGGMTHLATADEDPEFLAAQLALFEPFVTAIRQRARWGGVIHAANSAATLREPAAHYDLVRCGIAVYGCDPMHQDPAARGLEPALELSSYVAAVKGAQPGDSAGYGRRFVAERETWIATLPIGYGDGVRRALTNNCDVLIGGRRYPLVGTVSMDNITVDLGPDPAVRVGDAAVLIGRQGGERVTAEELARRIGTINYEVLCGISPRVPRVYHRDGDPA